MNRYTLCRIAASVAATAALFFAVWCVIEYHVTEQIFAAILSAVTVLPVWLFAEVVVTVVSTASVFATYYIFKIGGNDTFEFITACGMSIPVVFYIVYFTNNLMSNSPGHIDGLDLAIWVWLIPVACIVICAFYESRVSKFACRIFNKKGD